MAVPPAWRHHDGVLYDPFGVLKEKPFQFSESNLGAVEELRHLPATHDWQIATKQHAIEAGQHTMNPILMLGNAEPFSVWRLLGEPRSVYRCLDCLGSLLVFISAIFVSL